jgi:ubiquinone/menaquinone biosynthesis C-methylase UbiE
MKDSSIKNQVNVHYDKQWEEYSEKDVILRVKNLGVVIDSITAHIPKRSNLDILDLGCGPAVIPLRLNENLKGSFHSIFGIDLSQTACKLGQKVLKNNKLENIHLLLADCESLPFRVNTFDAVLSNATFNLLTDKERGFIQIAHVIKDGGIIVIGDCVAEEKESTCQTKCTSQWSQCIDGAPTEMEIAELAYSNGFEIVQIQDITETVRDLVTNGLWSWPEFLGSDLKYKIYTFQKTKVKGIPPTPNQIEEKNRVR